jgi:hypothetical protein
VSGPDLIKIAAGQQWAIPRGGPWPGTFPPVTVLDVREGWVRFEDSSAPDRRMEEPAFRSLYVPVQA